MLPEFKIASIERFWSHVKKSRGCWKWQARSSSGYGMFSLNGKSRGAHRASFALANGPIPDGLYVDHICHNTMCVRPSHLRLVTPKQNQENRLGASARNASGVRGVRWIESRGAWRARVGHDGKTFHAGYHATIEEAEAAVIAKRNELFTHNDLDRIPA